MFKQYLRDFEQGYCYACRRYESWKERTPTQDFNSLADAFSRMPQEHAQGIAAFLREKGQAKLAHSVNPACRICSDTKRNQTEG